MVRTLTLNPAVDRTLTVEGLALDGVNRVTDVRQDAGGKGLNVARVVGRLGVPVVAVAPQGGDTGRFLVDRLAAEGVSCRWHPISQPIRTNTKVVDAVSGTHTDLNEPGPRLQAEDLAALGALLLDGLEPGDWVVISGSLPPGVPLETYGRWILEARRAGARVAFDADGATLASGLVGHPDLVKPNQAELERWAGRSLATDEALLGAAEELRCAGADTVVVSAGSRGAWLVSSRGHWFSPAIPVEVRSTVGAGDALVAGLVSAYSQGQGDEGALALGMAAAAASVSQPGTGGATGEAARGLLGHAVVLPL